MLSMIDELDLQDFIEESEQEEPAQAGVVVLEKPAQTPEPTQAVEPETEEEPASNGLPLFLIVIMLTAVAGVGAYFYFKIYKPQHEQDNSRARTWRSATAWKPSTRMNRQTPMRMPVRMKPSNI